MGSPDCNRFIQDYPYYYDLSAGIYQNSNSTIKLLNIKEVGFIGAHHLFILYFSIKFNSNFFRLTHFVQLNYFTLYSITFYLIAPKFCLLILYFVWSYFFFKNLI